MITAAIICIRRPLELFFLPAGGFSTVEHLFSLLSCVLSSLSKQMGRKKKKNNNNKIEKQIFWFFLLFLLARDV
jgi:hypothetical protein